MSSLTAPKARKPFTRMTAAELAEATKGVQSLDFNDTQPLSPKMAVAWENAKRRRGRPRVGEGAEKVLISMERRLLMVTDELARRKGLDRSKLIALAVRELLAREAATAGAGAGVPPRETRAESPRPVSSGEGAVISSEGAAISSGGAVTGVTARGAATGRRKAAATDAGGSQLEAPQGRRRKKL